MKQDEQRIAIAKYCGKKVVRLDNEGQETQTEWGTLYADNYPLPDYINDLNAISEAVNTIPDEATQEKQCDRLDYLGKLQTVCGVVNYWDVKAMVIIDKATAAQRAEAFLKTLNLWTDA